jgi:hypothetical protein
MKPHRYFHVAALTFALVFANSAPAYCQSPQNNPASSPQIQIVKDQIRKIGTGEDVTVIMVSGMEYYGAISKIESDSFEIAEVDLKQMITIDYANVMKVEKGYGQMNSSTGKRQKGVKSRGFWIVLIAGVGATIGLAVWGFSRLGKHKLDPPAPQIPSPFPRFP